MQDVTALFPSTPVDVVRLAHQLWLVLDAHERDPGNPSTLDVAAAFLAWTAAMAPEALAPGLARRWVSLETLPEWMRALPCAVTTGEGIVTVLEALVDATGTPAEASRWAMAVTMSGRWPADHEAWPGVVAGLARRRSPFMDRAVACALVDGGAGAGGDAGALAAHTAWEALTGRWPTPHLRAWRERLEAQTGQGRWSHPAGAVLHQLHAAMLIRLAMVLPPAGPQLALALGVGNFRHDVRDQRQQARRQLWPGQDVPLLRADQLEARILAHPLAAATLVAPWSRQGRVAWLPAAGG